MRIAIELKNDSGCILASDCTDEIADPEKCQDAARQIILKDFLYTLEAGDTLSLEIM